MPPTAVIFVFFVRLAGYISTFFAPLFGLCISFFLDFIDSFAYYVTGLPTSYYHVYDKLIDILQYILLIPVAYRTPVFKLFCLLFAFRLVGQLIYMITGIQQVFVLFPNLIEYSLFIYFVIEAAKRVKIKNRIVTFISKLSWTDLRIWIPLLIFKIINEIGINGLDVGQNSYLIWERFRAVLHI